jgi:molecular chaperone DnaK
VENAISDVREALKGEDLGAIKRMTAALQQASHAMAEQMYKQNAPGGGAANQSGSDVKDGEVVDAEVVDA